MKELFLIGALALPSGSFKENVRDELRVYRMLVDYTQNVLGRSPRTLIVDGERHLVEPGWWRVLGAERHPPWKNDAFHVVVRTRPYEAVTHLWNSWLVVGLSAVVAPKGFLVLNIENDPTLAELLSRLGFERLPFYVFQSSVFQRQGWAATQPQRVKFHLWSHLLSTAS